MKFKFNVNCKECKGLGFINDISSVNGMPRAMNCYVCNGSGKTEENNVLNLELLLLNMWLDNGIKDIYKYKNRINAFQYSLTNIELFNDLTYLAFTDLEDIANHRYSIPEDFKVSVEDLIEKRTKKIRNKGLDL